MSNKKSADAYRDRVIALHKEGKKDSQIVRDLKISRGMVWRIMKAFKKGGHVAKPGSKKAAPKAAAPKAQPKAKAEAKKPEANPKAEKPAVRAPADVAPDAKPKTDPKVQIDADMKARAEAKLKGGKVTAKGL